MIKKPQWLLERIAELGDDIRQDRLMSSEAADELSEKILAEDRPLALAIIAEKSKSWLKTWAYQKIRDDFSENEALGQQVLPFPELPAHLEIAPATFKHQRVMTGKDWDNAEAIWKNRRDQAEVSYQLFHRVYERIRPLLADETLTTEDVTEDLG